MNRSDRARQVFVTVSTLAMGLGAMVGVGVLGTRVRDSAHGLLAADATLLAPAQGAFRIWTLIYIGLVAYCIWQWLPRNAASPRERSIGWWAGVSMLLNAAWIATSQINALTAGFIIIVAIAVNLCVVILALNKRRPSSRWEWVIVDGTFGLYLGWIIAAAFANLAVISSFTTPSGMSSLDERTAASLLVIAAVVGTTITTLLSARLAVTLGIVWGLVWIAIGRVTASPYSPATGTVAILCAAAVLACATLARAFLGIRRARGTRPSPLKVMV